MERVHLEFYEGAHIKILAHYIRDLTYVVLVTDFGQALTLLQYLTHSALSAGLFLHFHLWFVVIELPTLHV